MRDGHPARSARGDWSRRDFGRALVGASSVIMLGGPAEAAETAADSPLGRFCGSLSADQRRALVFPFDDPKRTMVQNHWAVVPTTIADLTAAQQALALDLIRQVCTPEGFARLTRQRDDDAGGWKHDHLAVFGSAADPRGWEWVVTGRHLTLRGSSLGTITGGPLFLGHTAAGAANAWADQAAAAAAFGRSLDDEQRRRAFAAGGRPAAEAGLDLAATRPDQRDLARRLVAAFASPFRTLDFGPFRPERVGAGHLDRVTWQGYRPAGSDPTTPPEIWRLTGPGFAWSFHAVPHVHSWFDSA